MLNLVTDEHYAFVPKGDSEYPVEDLGKGTIKTYVDTDLINEREVQVFVTATREYRSVNPTRLGTHIKKDKAGKTWYFSKGTSLPIQFKGFGYQELLDASRNLLQKTTGLVFLIYAVPIVLTKADARQLLHPALVWEELKEEFIPPVAKEKTSPTTPTVTTTPKNIIIS